MDTIIDLHNITAYRGDTCVFDGFSLEIGRGTNTVILGPNGAGKSTLLKLLAREIYPVEREDSYIRLFGRTRWNVEELRKRLGIVSHDLQSRYLGRARGSHVMLSGLHSSIDTYAHQQFTSEDRDRAEYLMRRLGVIELRTRRFDSMSTGQQRRFLLGRALMSDPEALILDEPTTSLDLRATFQYLDIIRELIEEGRTVIIATHHIHEIPPEIRRVVVLAGGRIRADGPKAQILTGETLSRVFDTPVQIVRLDGYYQALPAETCDELS